MLRCTYAARHRASRSRCTISFVEHTYLVVKFSKLQHQGLLEVLELLTLLEVLELLDV